MGFNSEFKGLKLFKKTGNGRLNNLDDPVLNVLTLVLDGGEQWASRSGRITQYTEWFKKMDSISYVYISWTIHGMWIIYITFERGGPKFSNTTARALA